jgi:hypothetical protein
LISVTLRYSNAQTLPATGAGATGISFAGLGKMDWFAMQF